MNVLSQSIVWRIYHQGEGSGHSGSEITLGAQATICTRICSSRNRRRSSFRLSAKISRVRKIIYQPSIGG
jgi:hypothetical protein